MQVRPLRAVVLALVLLSSACGTPPHKEMDQAQGAIDAAKAAGADRYAATEYNAATQSLQLATDAVAQRDYRLALNHALESREHAQNAAREAAATRARRRGEIERVMAEVRGLVAQAQGRLTVAEKGRVPRRLVSDARASLSQAEKDVQKAGAATQADDYDAAEAALSAAKQRITDLIASLEAATRPQPARRRG